MHIYSASQSSGFSLIFHFSLHFKTDLLHQSFHFVHCCTYKLFQCMFPIFNTRSEITSQSGCSFWMRHIKAKRKLRWWQGVETQTLTLKPHLSIVSCRTLTLLLPQHKPPGQVQKTQVYFDKLFPLSFVAKVLQFIPLIPVFNSIILNEEQIDSCCHGACCVFTPQLSTFLVVLIPWVYIQTLTRH